MNRTIPVEERFWASVDRSGPCWLWIGRFYPNGEPRLWHGDQGKDVSASRYAYELVHGPLEPRLRLRRQCDSMACIRPDHRKPMTQAEMRHSLAVPRGECSSAGCTTQAEKKGLCRSCYMKGWYTRDPERRRVVRLAWLQRTGGAAKYQQAWRERNPELNLHRGRTRRAQKVGVDLTLTLEEWLEVLELFGYCCAYCPDTKDLAQDHVVPVSRGGAHSRGNVVPCCKRCNSSKSNKTLAEFLGHGAGS